MSFYDAIHKDEIRSGFYLLLVPSSHDSDYVRAFKVLPVTVRWVEGEVHTSHSFSVTDVYLTAESRAAHPELANRLNDINGKFYADKAMAEARGIAVVQRSLQTAKAIIREISE